MKEFSLYKTIFYGSIFAFILFLVFQIDFGNGIEHWGEVGEPLVIQIWHYWLLLGVIWYSKKDS